MSKSTKDASVGNHVNDEGEWIDPYPPWCMITIFAMLTMLILFMTVMIFMVMMMVISSKLFS
jgi:hypothetical protein